MVLPRAIRGGGDVNLPCGWRPLLGGLANRGGRLAILPHRSVWLHGPSLLHGPGLTWPGSRRLSMVSLSPPWLGQGESRDAGKQK